MYSIFRNRSAEKLYGWKDYEILGQRVADYLIDEAYYALLKKIMDKLTNGQSWSGQFPLKKRSGEIFMAIVTKSPLYEDGDFVGVITVSSDAALFINITSQNLRTCGDRANCQPKVRGLNLKKIQWQSQPQIASSISNLVLMCNTYTLFLFTNSGSFSLISKWVWYKFLRPQKFCHEIVRRMQAIHVQFPKKKRRIWWISKMIVRRSLKH